LNDIIIDGGKLQIGTENQPFTNKCEIKFRGTTLDLPVDGYEDFGYKGLYCINCTLDIHGVSRDLWG
jgi:hypothetical protein